MSPERRQDASGYYYARIPYNHDAEIKAKKAEVTQDAEREKKVVTVQTATWEK